MPAGDEDNIVDKAIGNPAFDQLFGYHIFFRRAAIPVLLFLIGILSYTMLESLFSFSSDTILTKHVHVAYQHTQKIICC